MWGKAADTRNRAGGPGDLSHDPSCRHVRSFPIEGRALDAFRPSLKLERRDALWATKVLRDEALPLFTAAVEREMAAIAEQQEPDVGLRQTTEGHNVMEDYGACSPRVSIHSASDSRLLLVEFHRQKPMGIASTGL